MKIEQQRLKKHGKERKKMEDSGTTTLWPEHHQTIPSQCKGGGTTVNGFTEGVVWWRGEKTLFLVSS